ncbi:UDP-galactopyranose mutase [Falsiroseomonas sp. E2-1-a20]|uniref:UDP-galactopyranose mutase n=1 Tax=Falsiroseomonas sp. E2-1-a20 TaxID=3239300 RepID=UPI003F3BAAA0
MAKILVIGAGLAGAAYAREFADSGHEVRVIDRRDHVAGNCYDFLSPAGVRLHRYGPHLFHTSNMRVVEWLSRFTEWEPYEHRVVARLADGALVPLPINVCTVNGVYGTDIGSAEAVQALLDREAVRREPIVSAEDHLYATIGPRLTEMFFAPYTEKMWNLRLSDLDPAVVRRVQVRIDTDDRYFPGDSFQAMPRAGYTAMFQEILRSPRIEVALETAFTPEMEADYDLCLNSMPIDEYFGYRFGELPYRSIRFHHSDHPVSEAPSHVTINYTDRGPHTRETWWHNIPGHRGDAMRSAVRTVEEPCDYRDNNYERYYPVKTLDGRYDDVYRQYQALAADRSSLRFIGRCGTYQYLDMHQVLNQSLIGAEKLLEKGRPVVP